MVIGTAMVLVWPNINEGEDIRTPELKMLASLVLKWRVTLSVARRDTFAGMDVISMVREAIGLAMMRLV